MHAVSYVIFALHAESFLYPNDKNGIKRWFLPEYKIPDLVKMFQDGEIEIPELQREFVWSDNQIRDLAESIYKRYPIGLLTFFKVPLELRSRQERYWVLDGQQRLLSLAVLMNGRVEAIRGGQRSTVRVDIWFDPLTDRFELRQPRDEEEVRRWIKLSELLQIREREALEKMLMERNFSPDEKGKISTLWGTFRSDYKVLVYELLEDLDLDDLGNIFVRTNFAGTRVRGTDVYSTMIAVAYPGLVKELRDFCAGLPIEIDYGVLIRTFVAFLTDGKVKLASRVFEQANKLKEILSEKKAKLGEISRGVKECTARALEILRRFGISRLPSESVIPVMSYYIYKRGAISPKEEEGLFKWFILASGSYFRRYSTSVETRLNQDLTTINEGGNYRDLIENIEKLEGVKERVLEYIDAGWCDQLLLYALLTQSNAKDPLSGETLTQANSVLHHIFPVKHLTSSGREWTIDDVGNFTLLTHFSNLKLLDELPENYLQKFPLETLKAHYIPEERELWRLERVEEFVKMRKENLKRAVEKFFVTI
jgi:hypothetical protein